MEIKTPNYTETPLPSAPPAEGIQPLPGAISDATQYLLHVLDPMSVRVGSQDLSRLSLEGLSEILDKTESLLAKLMPSAPPLAPEAPHKPIPSAPPLPLNPANANPALPAPAARLAAAVATPQRAPTLTGIAPRAPLPANPAPIFGKIALTNSGPPSSIGRNAAATPSATPSQSAKNTNAFSSPSEPAPSTTTKSAQKEPLAQNMTAAAAVIEIESAVFEFSESISFNGEALGKAELVEQTVIQIEQTAENRVVQEERADVSRTEVFAVEERMVDAPVVEQTVQESEKELTKESALILNGEKEVTIAEAQESRSILEEIASPKTPNSNTTEPFFSERSPIAQNFSDQNQSAEKSPLPQSSSPSAPLPNSLQNSRPQLGSLSSPTSPHSTLSSEIHEQISLPSAAMTMSGAPSSQILSPLKIQTPLTVLLPTSLRPTLTALRSFQELQDLSLEPGALKPGSNQAQSSNHTPMIAPYSAQSPLQGSSPSKSTGASPIQPVAEFPDEDFDEEDDEEDEEEEEDDEDDEPFEDQIKVISN